MARISRLTPEFVDTMPDSLEDGIIYISQKYRIALHRCACGCGEEVSTPLGPTEFTVRMDADLVTVWPSIGNHDYPCKSHYVIDRGMIVWAGAMSRQDIEKGRAYDRFLKRGKPRRNPIEVMFDAIRTASAYVHNLALKIFGRK